MERGSTVRQEGLKDTFDSNAIPTPACNRMKNILTLALYWRKFYLCVPHNRESSLPNRLVWDLPKNKLRTPRGLVARLRPMKLWAGMPELEQASAHRTASKTPDVSSLSNRMVPCERMLRASSVFAGLANIRLAERGIARVEL